jgi:long-chain fatty acid transport protein
MNDIDLRTHNYLRYGREAQKTMIMVGVGFGFFDDAFGVGAGANVTFAGQGNTMISGTEVGPSEQTPMIQNQMDLKTVPTPVAGLYVKPGKFISALEGLQIGAAYRHETYVEIDPFATRNQLKVGTATMDLKLALLDFYTPYIFSAGVAYDFRSTGIPILRGLTISLDVQYEMWSKFRVSSAIEALYAKLVEEEAVSEDYLLIELEDIIVPRVGIAYEVTGWLTLYSGYYYQPSFVPDEAVAGAINYLDNNRHVVSCGLTLVLPRTSVIKGLIQITLGFQAQLLEEREIVKRNPTAYNPGYTYGGWNPSGIIEVSMRF